MVNLTSEINEKFLPQFPLTQGDAFKCLVLSQKQYPEILHINCKNNTILILEKLEPENF